MAPNKKKSGLGKGLDALFFDNAIDESTGGSVKLGINEIEPNRDQPRKTFDEQALSELAQSIAEHGVIQPLLVRPMTDGSYQLIAGERRWRASRMAGLSEVPVVIREMSDSEAMELSLVENLQREDLNPMEEARGYQKLISDYDLTQEETARSVGKSRTAVTNSLRLLRLCPAVSELVEEGKLSSGHARALLAVEQEELQKKAAEEVVAKALSVRKTELLAARLKKASRSGIKAAPDPLTVDYAAEISRELTAQLGRKVTLSESRTGGKIVLEYYSADDRERLIQNLMAMQ
jgi:ParB family chromosome partitioning protein